MEQKELVDLVLAADAIVWQAKGLENLSRALLAVRGNTTRLAGETNALLELYERSSDMEGFRERRRNLILSARDNFWGGHPKWGRLQIEKFIDTFRQ